MEEMIDDAKDVVKDYNENPSEESGSYVSVHETSPYLKEQFTGDSWKKIVYSTDMKKLLKDVSEHNKKTDKNKKK